VPRTLQAQSQIPRVQATYTGPQTRTRTDLTSSAPDSQQKVGTTAQVITVTKEDFERLKLQLELSQSTNSQIQKELHSTQQRALSQDIQLKPEITELTQTSQNALQRADDANTELINQQGELQVSRTRELRTLE